VCQRAALASQLKLRVWLALGIALLLWSSAYAGIRAGLAGFFPGQLAVPRFVIASTVLAVYAAGVPFRRPDLRDVPGLILSASVGITFCALALNYGETRVAAGAGSMIIASTPIWTALLAALFLKERLPLLGGSACSSVFSASCSSQARKGILAGSRGADRLGLAWRDTTSSFCFRRWHHSSGSPAGASSAEP